jgi:hypothetical protein
LISNFSLILLVEAWEQMLKFTSFRRQEINLVFKIKKFIGSKFGILINSIYFYFPKIWVVTKINI